MKQYLIGGTFALMLLSSCGDGKKDPAALLNEKKAALEKLRVEKNRHDEEIKKLEAELEKLDSNAAANKVKLVSVAPVAIQDFKHFIDLQGQVDADDISYIGPRGAPGQVKAIYIKQGQLVKKGQLVLKLEDAIIRQQISASRQQLEGIKTQLAFSKNLYNRQKNLWDQGIGTEVQLITAKTNMESLENQLKAAQEQVKIAEEQLKTTSVYSDVTGIADEVNVKVGEYFQGVTSGSNGPVYQVRIVNSSSLKVVTNVPENYAARVHQGSKVTVVVPDVNRTYQSSVSLISQLIDPTKRGFTAEVKIPSDGTLKPNQLAVVKILDYAADKAVVVPVNVVQTDEKGKYVYVQEKAAGGKTIARKKSVIVGEVYGNIMEIKSGLAAGEQIITEGYQSLYEGQLVSTSTK